MPAFQINEREWSALYDEPHRLFKLYCAIRQYMDYRTGIAGLERRFSEQMFREALYVSPSRGRPKDESGSPTKKAIYHCLEMLARIRVDGGEGPPLLEPMKHLGAFVFRLPAASLDSSAQKQRGPKGGRKSDAKGDSQEPEESSNDGGLGDQRQAKGGRLETDTPAQRGTPQGSGNISTTTTRARPKTLIPEDWQPSARCWELIKDKEIPRDFAESLIGEFVLYWRNDRAEKRPGWDATFLNHCKLQWEKRGRGSALTPRSSRDATSNPDRRGGHHDRPVRKNHHAQVWEYIMQPDTDPAEALGQGPVRQDDGDIRPQVVEFLPRCRGGGSGNG